MSKIVKIISATVIALIILLALITGSNILFFWSIFNWLQHVIHVIPAIDESLAKGLAALLLAVVVMLPLGKMLLSFTPIPQKNKSLYRSLIFVSIGIFFIFMYLGTEKIYFDPQTGLPMKYYSIGVDGKIKLSTVPGYSSETGDKLLPVTKEVIQKMNGVSPREVPVIFNKSQSNYQTPVSQPKSEPRKIIEATINKKMTEPKKVVKPQKEKSPKSLTEILIGKSDTTEEKKTGTLSVSVSGQETKEVTGHSITPGLTIAGQESVQEYNKPTGYSVSILGNNNLKDLLNVFERMSGYGYYGEKVACETIFNNTSQGTFDIYNSNRKRLFRIPPRKKLVLVMEPNSYYFRAIESSEFTPLNLPNRDKFLITISNEETVEPGKIFTGMISGN